LTPVTFGWLFGKMQGTSLEARSVMSSKLKELKVLSSKLNELVWLSLITPLFFSYNRRSTVRSVFYV